MKIGIDIDDTLTDIRDELKLAAEKYASELGKKKREDKYIEDNNNGNTYQIKYGFTYEELKYFLSVIHEGITQKAAPRENCVEIIKKLHDEGHEIYIITARDYEFHEDPYKLSKDWLDKNNVYYDKLIVNARNKLEICRKENIELFIDDQLANCTKLSEAGIKVIRITEYTDNHGDIANKKNWNEIYNYIKETD